MLCIGLVFRTEMLVLNMREQCLKQVSDSLAMLGADCDRLAESKAIGVERAAFSGPPLGLVGDDDHRRGLGAEPAPDLLIEGRNPFARVDQEERRVGLADGSLGLLTHAARKACRVLILESCGVDHSELEAEQ